MAKKQNSHKGSQFWSTSSNGQTASGGSGNTGSHKKKKSGWGCIILVIALASLVTVLSIGAHVL